jgi:hypothetical protein
VAELQYQSEELRQQVDAWGRSRGIDVHEQLLDALVDRFEVTSATILDVRPVADTLLIRMESSAWAGQKELAVLPTGGVAW